MAKNKSIRQGAGDLRNPAVRTGYQVKAQPVDTFVRTNAGQREKMIADALNMFGESVSNLGRANAKVAEEEEREIELKEAIKAKNAAAEFTPSLINHIENSVQRDAQGNLTSKEDVYNSWEGLQGFTDATASITHPFGKQYLDNAIGTALSEAYGKAVLASDIQDTKETLNKELDIGLADDSLVAYDVWYNFDEGMGNAKLGKLSSQDRMEELLTNAERHLRETGSTSGFDYIEARGMGNDKWKLRAEAIKETALNAKTLKDEKERRRKLNKLTDTKTELLVEAGARLIEDPNADLTDILIRGNEAGIPGFKADLNGLEASYDPSKGKEFVMDNEDKSILYDELSNLSTKDAQLKWLINNASKIDRVTYNTWLGWVNGGSIFRLEDDADYQMGKSSIDDMIKVEGATDRLTAARYHFKDIYTNLIATDEYKKMDSTARVAASKAALETALARAGVTGDGGESQPLSFTRKLQEQKAEEQRLEQEQEQEQLNAAAAAMDEAAEAKQEQERAASTERIREGSGTLEDFINLGLEQFSEDPQVMENTVSLINEAIAGAGLQVDEEAITNIIQQVSGEESRKAEILQERADRKKQIIASIRFGTNDTRSSFASRVDKIIAEEEKEALEDAQEELKRAERKLSIMKGEIKGPNPKEKPWKRSPKAIAKAQEAVKRAEQEVLEAERVIATR